MKYDTQEPCPSDDVLKLLGWVKRMLEKREE